MASYAILYWDLSGPRNARLAITLHFSRYGRIVTLRNRRLLEA